MLIAAAVDEGAAYFAKERARTSSLPTSLRVSLPSWAARSVIKRNQCYLATTRLTEFSWVGRLNTA
jgi:hypothetical protein